MSSRSRPPPPRHGKLQPFAPSLQPYVSQTAAVEDAYASTRGLPLLLLQGAVVVMPLPLCLLVRCTS